MENTEKKTLQHLNSKAWYRAIKVIYLLLFLAIVALIITLFSVEGDFDVLDIPNSKIVCQYGNEKQFLVKEIFGKNELPSVLPEYYRTAGDEFSQKILKYCEISKIITRSDQPSGFIPDPYRIEEKTKKQFGYLLLSLLITIGIFEAVRRIFYYIVLGSIKPQK